MAIEKVITKVRQEEQTSDLSWWLSKTPQERIAALELIRHEYNRGKYGPDIRLQRVCRVVKQATPDNSNRMIAALVDFGFGSVNLTQDDFLKPGWVVQLGNPPNRKDLLTSVSGLEFEEAYTQRNVVDVNELPVPFVSLKELMRNKKATGRPQDIADISQLQKVD